MLCSWVTHIRPDPQIIPDVWSAENDVSAEQAQDAQAAVSARTEKLSVRTRTWPKDVAAWLQYVQHQQDVMRVANMPGDASMAVCYCTCLRQIKLPSAGSFRVHSHPIGLSNSVRVGARASRSKAPCQGDMCAGRRLRIAQPLAAKQLAILEVALQANPESEELLLVTMTQVLPEVRGQLGLSPALTTS